MIETEARQCLHCGGPMDGRGPAAKTCGTECARLRRNTERRTPEARAARNEYQRGYRRNPEARERANAPRRTPEYRKRRVEHESRPEIRERIRENQRKHHAKRVAKVRGYRERRNARQRKRGSVKRGGLVDRLIERQFGMCGICREPLPMDRAEIHVDHVVPLARGGGSEEGNLQAAHAMCNMRKGANLQ